MEQQSGNNFDTLFQKAAEEYPLRTDNKNWDNVAVKLKAPISSVVKTKKWQYAALLLLLLMTGGFLSYKFYKTNNNKPGITFNKASKVSSNNLQQKQPLQKQTNINQSEKAVAKKGTINLSQEDLISAKQPTQKLNASINNIPINSGSNIEKLNTDLFAQTPSISLNNDSKNKPVNEAINHQTNISQNNPNLTNETPKLLTNNEKNNVSYKESQHIKLVPQPETFYGELFFAPDFATVKFQHISKPQYNIGVALGYKISNRLSAELGLQRLHTDFYSSGKYLNTANIKFKAHTIVQSVNGQSKLTEVPFNLKYNFSKNKERFFATAGLNIARIIHTEKYDYHVTRDGAHREVSRHFGALTSTKFFSDLNFSVGYQTAVFGLWSVRAEPYYQAPLKGLGIGDLPVNNFGVKIGIVKDFK